MYTIEVAHHESVKKMYRLRQTAAAMHVRAKLQPVFK